MEEDDWINPNIRFLGVEMRMARGTPSYDPRLGAIYLVFNAGPQTRATLPEALPGHRWQRVIDTSGKSAKSPRNGIAIIRTDSVVAFDLCPVTTS
jgi:glycogen operon protein